MGPPRARRSSSVAATSDAVVHAENIETCSTAGAGTGRTSSSKVHGTIEALLVALECPGAPNRWPRWARSGTSPATR